MGNVHQQINRSKPSTNDYTTRAIFSTIPILSTRVEISDLADVIHNDITSSHTINTNGGWEGRGGEGVKEEKQESRLSQTLVLQAKAALHQGEKKRKKKKCNDHPRRPEQTLRSPDRTWIPSRDCPSTGRKNKAAGRPMSFCPIKQSPATLSLPPPPPPHLQDIRTITIAASRHRARAKHKIDVCDSLTQGGGGGNRAGVW